MSLKIRIGQVSELLEIQQLFADTISFVCQNDYNPVQIDAWKSSIKNTNRWVNIIENQFFIVAEQNQKIVGFASLDNGNYIDVLFVHKDFQRQGIAEQLFNRLLDEINHSETKIITVDVSITAKSFFEANGFKIMKEQIEKRNDIELINYKMTRIL